jgi:hypothetical protein
MLFVLCGEDIEVLYVKPVGAYSNYWVLKG